MEKNFSGVAVDAANVSVLTVEHIEANKGNVKWALKKDCLKFVPAKGKFKVTLRVDGYGSDSAEMKTKVGFYVGDACYAFQRKGTWSKYLDRNDCLDDSQEGRVTVTCDDGDHSVSVNLEETR